LVKWGGIPEVKWGDYEKSVIHVRTSHVPRFEVEISADHSLFELMGISYDDAVLYLLTFHGVICHQARDLFSAGSVANPENDDEGGIYIERALKLIEKEIIQASLTMDDALFVEYWGESVPPKQRIKKWLEKADALAHDWTPSKSLF